MKKTLQLLSLLALMCVPWVTQAQETLTVADGTATNSYVPVYGLYCDDYQKAHFVYPSDLLDEMSSGSQISQMVFYLSSAPAAAWTGSFNIYLSEVDYTSISAYADVNTMQQVYTGTLDATSGTMTVEFDATYTYNGGNLLVAFEEYQYGSYKSASFYGISSNGSCVSGYNGSSLSNVSTNQRNFLPKVTFTYIPGGGALICTKPATLNVFDITSGGASFSWSSTDAGLYQFETKNDVDSVWSVWAPQTDTFATFSFESNTAYNARVKALCSDSLESGYRSVNFRTLCAPLNEDMLPYVEDFEGYGTGSSQSISPCWAKGTNSTTAYPYPYSTAAINGERGLYFYGYHTSSATSTMTYSWAALPPVDESVDISSLMLTFNAKRYSSTSTYYHSTIMVGIAESVESLTSAGVIDSMVTWMGYYDLTTEDAGTVIEERVSLANYQGNGKYIVFYCPSPEITSGTYAYNYIYIDDVVLRDIPTCSDVTGLIASDITAESITLTWDYAADSYTLYNMADGSVLGTMTDTAYTIAGLAPTTNYTFGVAANCGSEQGYMTTITVRTACGAFSVPYTWTFEDDATNANPSCWTKEGAGSATVTSSSSNSHSGSMYLKFSGSTSNLVVLPLTEAEINTLQLRFWTRPESYTNSSCGTFSVGYMVDTTFVEVANYAYDDFNAYTEKIVNFTNAPAGARIAMRHNAGSSSWYWYVDDVTVMEAPECAEVIQITEEVTNCGSYTWNGQTYNQSGLYNITLQAENGCDSVINTLVLTVNQPVYVERSVVAEDSYTWNGVTYTESGFYTYMTTAANGCDSITILNLTINTTCTGNYCNITIVGSDSYGDGWNGNAINVVQGGNIIGTFTIENGSDFTSEFNVCSSLPVSFHWVSGNYADETSFQILDGGGTEVYVGLDAQIENFFTLDNACPSCLPVNGLSVTSTTNSATLYWYTDTIESGITYNIYVNDNLYASGVSDNYYVVSNLASNTEYTLGVQLVCSADDASTVTTVDVRTACDGISYQTFEATACGNYYYEGYTFTESGVYGDTIYDEYGCMVARTLVLTIYPEYYDTIQATGTNYFVWYGDTLTGDGIYPHIGESVNSCDSIEFLMLSINYDMACGEGVSSITAKNADASDATNQYVPGYSLYNYSYSEVIIPAESLEGIGTVKALQFKPASTNGGNMFTNCEVYLANTSNDNLSTGFTADRSSFQQVWSGDMNYTSTDWQTLMFTTPFVWDGTSNIVVAVIRNHGSYASGSSFEAYTADAQLARYAYQDNTPYTISDVSAGNANVSNTPAWYKLLGCNDGAVISCARVRDQYAEAASNSVALYWSDPSNTGATYSVYSITDSDTMLVASNIADTMYVVSNLEANTPYQFAIVANCGAGDASTMARVSVRTQCAAISSLPYTTSFEADELVGTAAVDALPWCWTRYNDATSGTSYPYSISSSYAHTGSRLLYFYTATSATYANVEMAIMPIIDVNVLPLNTLRLRFYARSSSNGNGIIEVGTVSDPTDPTTFTYVQSFSVIGTEHELKTVTGFPANGDQYIAFRMLRDSATYHYVYIDDLTLDAIPSCLEPNDLVVTNVTENSASIEWTGNAANYLVTCDSMQYVVEGTSFTVTGLASSTDYTVGVQAVCSAADISSAVYVTFHTSGIPAELPYYTSFEEGEDQGWDFVNGTNGWAIGNATAVNGTNALYISNDNGVSNSYTISNAASTSYAYRTIRIDEPGQYNISYCWKGQGESSWDFLRAWLAPANAQFVANTYPDNATTYQNGYSPDGWLDLGGRMNLNSEWQCFSHMVDVATPGNYNVVFMWRNDNSGGNNPPIAVDNVEVAHVSCPNPVYPLLTSTAYSITATWEPGGNENAWVLELVDAASGSVVDNAVASDTMYTFDGLNSNTGYGVYIRALCDEGDTSTSIGSWITTDVSCMTVRNITVSVGDTSVFVAWSDTSVSEWDVIVVDQGNGLDSAFLSFTSYGTSVELTNMEAGSYYLYVRARCSEEEVSEWAGPVAFTIAAVVPPVEMTCDGSNPITVGNTDASDATNQYIPGYSYYEYSYSEVIIPAESLAGIGTVKALQFKPTTADGGSYFTNCEVYLANTSADNLEEGFVQDTNSFQLVWSGDMSYSTDDWQTLVFNSPFVWDGASNIVVAVNRGHGAWTNGSSFAAYTAESQLGRYVYRDGTPYAIGSITGGTAVNTPAWYKLQGCDDGAVITCARVRDQYADAVTSNSALLRWSDTVNEGGASYSIYAIAEGDTTLVASEVYDTIYALYDLEANTQYLFAIEANCGAGDASTMARVSVRTQCAAIGSLPYTTSFEAAELQGTDALQAIPWCWTRINNLTSGDNYYPYAFSSSYSNYAHEGVYCMEFYASTWGTYADTTGLVLPALDVTSYPMDGNRVTFWAKKSGYSSDTINYTLLVGTMSNPADMSTFAPVQSVVVDATEYTKYTVSLAGANATDAYVAVMAPKVNSTMYLDDLTLEVQPNCPDVTGLALVDQTSSSALVGWSTNGAASYEVEVRQDGNSLQSVTITVADTTALIEGLDLDNDYQIYVRAICGNDMGSWSDPVNVHIGFCLPNPTSCDNQGITSVTFGSMTNAETHPAAAPFYGDYTEMSGTVPAGTTATVDITYATGYSYGTIIWVDWDNSLSFDADEVVYKGESTNANPTTLTATLDIPATQPLGSYRMRIAGADMFFDDCLNNPAINPDPCGTFSYGVVEDYTLVVSEVPNCMAPSNLSATVTATEATLSWQGTGNETEWIVVVGDMTFLSTSNTFTVTGLDPMTHYDVSVAAVCGAGDTSLWTSTSFNTECVSGNCEITIYAVDSWGDGWNGGSVNVIQNGVTADSYSMPTQEQSSTLIYDTAIVDVCAGTPISLSWTKGNYDAEVSFQIVNAQGSVVSSVDNGNNLSNNQVFLNLDDCYSSPSTIYDTIDMVACGNYWWNKTGNQYTESGLYTVETTNTLGFISYTTLNLTVNPTYYVYDTVETVGNYYNEANGVFVADSRWTASFYSTVDGCDSTVQRYIHVTPFATADTQHVTACEYYNYGNRYYAYESGIYEYDAVVGELYLYDTVYYHDTVYEYDTVMVNTWYDIEQVPNFDAKLYHFILDLTINYNAYSESRDTTYSDYYVWNGDTLRNSSTMYSHTFPGAAANGCDSTAYLTLTILSGDVRYATACDYFNANGRWFYESGIHYYDSTICDTVNRMEVYAYDDYVYDSTGNGQYVTRYDTSYYTELDCYTRTFALDLTINYSTWHDTTVYAVDYFVFGGDTLENSGWYEHSFQVPGACDSSVYLHLIIMSGDTINVTACDWYEAHNGWWYNESGLYTFDSTDAEGITRTYLLNLTINHSTWHDDTVYAVDYYVFGGDTLTNSGWYVHTFQLPGGCDSNAYISLVIISGDTINVTACDWYETSNGSWYYESGLYTFDSTDAEGNTRTYLLNLTINHSYWFDTSVITPDYYVFGGDTLTESGWYQKTYTAVNGCDSTIGLNLDVRVIHDLAVNTNGGYLYVGAVGELIWNDTVLMVGEGYQFLQLVTFDPVTGGYYGADGEHSRLYELYIDGQPVDLSESVSNDVYTLNVYNYLASSGYNIYNINLNMYGNHSIEAVYGPYYNDSVCLSFGWMNVYGVTTDSAIVTWIRGSGADTYTISYGSENNLGYNDTTGTYYFVGDYNTETVTGTDTTITYQLTGLQSNTGYAVLVEMTCDGGEVWQAVRGFTTQGLPHTITVTNNGGSAWREELDRRDTTVVFTGHEGESFFTYLYSNMPETDSMWYGRTDRCQLHNIIIDGDTIDVLQNSSSDVYDLWVNQDGDYIYYELNVYYNADHTVEYVFGPYDETMWPEYCVAPRDLNVDYATNSSVAITWEHYDDIYVVDLYTLDGEVVYHDTTFSGYYEFTDLASSTEYYAVVGTVCPNGTNRTSAINVQTYSGEMHTITFSSNGGFVWTDDNNYFQPVDLTFNVYEGQTVNISLLSFAADGQGFLSQLGLDQSKWQLKHLYFDGVDILNSYNDSTNDFLLYIEHYNENDFVYDAYGLQVLYNADHSIVAEFGPYDAVEHTITIINHGGGYVDDQMSGGYGFFTQDTNVITGYEGDYISLRLISMHPNKAPYLVNHDSTMLVRLVFDGEEYLFDGSDSRVFINDQGNVIYYGWGVQDIYFDADHTIEVWFEPWTREYIYDTVELTIEGEGYVYNMDEGMMVTGDTTFTVSDDSWTRLQFVTLDPVVGSYNGFEEGCRLNALIIDGEYVSLDGNINGDGYNIYTYNYLWNNGYIIYYVYLNGGHTVHAVFGPYHDSTLCTTMTRMQLSEQYDTSAVVSWVAGNGTNTYHLYYGLADNFNYDSVDFYGDYTEQVITGDQEQFVYQMNGLQPSSHYIVMLKMFCENSDGWWYTYRDLYTSGDPHSITFSNNGGYLDDQTLSGRDTTIVTNYYDGWSYGTYVYSMSDEYAQTNGLGTDRCKLYEIIVDGVSVDLTTGDTTEDYMLVQTSAEEGLESYFFRIYYNADHTVQFVFGPNEGQPIDEPQVDTVFADMVACDSYEWNGSVYTESGIYVDSVVDADSVHVTILNLTVNHSSSASVDMVACDSYEWNGETYTESGEYTFNTVNAAGCDSTVTLNLVVNYSNVEVINYVACDSYEWNGMTYTQSGEYTYETDNAAGCDSTVTLNLIVNYSSAETVSDVACDSYEWNGMTYTQSGEYTYETENAAGCDSVVTLNLTVNYSNASDTVAVACNNFTWYGVAYGETGEYTNTFTNAAGCDSVVTLHLTVNNSTSSVANITACDSYTWHGVNYTASNNTASFDTVNAAGCDSTVTLNLTVNYSSTSSETRTACNSYVWHGNEYYASTDATYSTVNAAGCDSTVTLHLTVNQCSTTEIMACESYTWHGVEYYTSGTYVDGTDTLVLTVNYNNSGFEYVVVCNSYMWYGTEFTSDTLATYTATNADGCDSVITLWLFVNQCSTEDVTACGSYNWHGLELTSSGMYVDGFDTLNLTIKNGTTGDTIASACGSYNWYGDLYTESGNYTHVLTNASGCDSILTLHLTINECLTDYVTACGSYTWHGNTYTSSGTFNDGTDTLVLTLKRSTTGDTFAIVCNSMEEWYEHSNLTTSQSVTHTFEGANRFGCDSIVTLHLVVRPCLNDTVTACGSYVWNGITYISSGTYRNGNNTLVLTINSASTGDTFATACNSYDWYEHTPTASGSYRHTIVNGNAAGCDSVVTLHLTVNHCSTTYATACDSYEWNGFSLTSSGTYNMAYDTLVLTINHSNTGDTVAMACNSFTWHGVEYTEDTVATYTETNAAGCDSTVSMHLMIMNCAVDTVTACNSYLWHGNTYTSSGTYHYDNETLILTVNRSTTGDTFATVCGYLEWNDVAYAESGNYVDTLTNAAGCDSVVTLHLTVKNCSRTVAEACDSYEWHELTFTSSGTYILGNDTLVLTIHRSSHGDTLAMATGSFDWYEYTGIDSSTNLSHLFPEANVYGCDSTVTLHLLVVNNSAAGGESGNDTVVACDSYNWRGFVISSTGVYPFNNDTLWLTIHRSNSGDTIAEACNNYEWYGVDYTESGNYTHTFTNVHGCDSIITLHLTVNQCSTTDTAVCESYVWHGYTITSSGTYRDGRDTLILAVHRSNSGDTAAEACGSFSWYDVAYAESGNYTNTFTNAAGCDSVVTLHLTINECSTIDTAVCGSFTWRGYTLTSSGTYNIGFDTLNLTVKRSTTGFESVTAFNSYEWHNRVFTESTDTATYLTTNAAGCDSTVTLHLTVNQTSRLDTTVCDSMVWRGYTITSSGIYFEGFDTLALTVRRANSGIAIEQACNSFYWHGVDYTESGTYTFDTVNVWGCDSTARLYLTVNQCSTEEVTACGSYSWHNFTITSSGTYADGNDTLVLTIKQSSYGDTMATALGTFNWYEHLGVTETQNLTHTFVGANADGCDSTVTLHLTVFHGSSRDTVVCDSYTWHGNTFTSSGIYKNGYDTLYLTVNRSTTGTMTASACDSYTWNGTTYTESDTATFATLNVAGCDSVATLYLTINKPNNTATTQVACNSYTWNGNAYTESGDYTNSFSDGNGCTQVDTLHLTINSTVEATENVTVCDSYSLNGTTYTESATIVSSGTTVGGCDSIVTINLTVNHSVATADSVAVCDEYIFGGTTYTESAVIVSNGTAVNGCDSVATINLTVNHSVTTHDSITVHQSNLPITYLGEVINAAGDYEIHGSTAAGCDSTIYLHVTVSGIGIDVVNLDNVKLYPNPTRGKVTVTADNVEKIEVMNIVGRTVAVFTDTNVIDLSNLSEGSYTLRITLPEGNVIRKVIKR